MLLCVPEPVCQTASGNSASCFPARTSAAARWIASRFLGVEQPEGAIHVSAHFLDGGQRVDHGERHALGRDAKEAPAALGLSTPQPLGGDLDRPRKLSFSMRVRPCGPLC